MTFSIRRVTSLVMSIILGADSVILTSAWIVSSTDASVAAATTTGVLKPEETDDLSRHHHLNKFAPENVIPHPLLRLPFLFNDWDIKFRSIFVPPPLAPPESPLPESSSSSSWSHSFQDDSIPCTYNPVWDWQTDFFQQHLTNFAEIPLPDPSLAVVQNDATRVRTKWFHSDEYRLIRMTYMDGGDKTQIFTTVCYPRANLPIMGHGLLQVGERRITISDFQPLHDSHDKIAEEYLQPIQQKHPSLNQEMSERFFQHGEFWSDWTLLGRFAKSDETIWDDLWPAYKACVETHVQLTQESTPETKVPNDELLQKHAEYDAHVSSRDPAIKMLTGIFGAETATKIVYEALFPLAYPPSP